MRVLVNFSDYKARWIFHCIAADACTPISPFVPIASQAALMRLLRYMGATEEAITVAERDIQRWGHGGIWIDIPPRRKNLLRLYPPWNAEMLAE